jgi:hypothetical protein
MLIVRRFCQDGSLLAHGFYGLDRSGGPHGLSVNVWFLICYLQIN